MRLEFGKIHFGEPSVLMYVCVADPFLFILERKQGCGVKLVKVQVEIKHSARQSLGQYEIEITNL